jgi:DNA processing protein
MGRELFAVPGSPLDPRCRGSNELIRSGAQLVESASDVLGHLPEYPAKPALAGVAEPAEPYQDAPLAPDRARSLVLENLGHDPTAIDDLVRRCQLSASAVVAALLELELGGRLEVLPGNKACLLG